MKILNGTCGENVTWTLDSNFFECTRLVEIKIPANVVYIDEEIFDGCTSLKKIYYKAGSGFEEKLSQGNDAELIAY